MKKTKRGVKQFFVMALTTMLVTESVFMPVSGKVNKGASAQTETVEQQISDNSVGDHEVESVSANFVLEKDNETSENSVLAMNDGTSADQESAEYSGTDGDLTWSIDADGLLTVTGKGDYKAYADWTSYGSYIKSAYISVQEITSMKEFFAECYYLEDIDFADTDTSKVTDMSRIFFRCYRLQEIDISMLDFSNVTTMEGMFSVCSGLKDIHFGNVDTSQVRYMNSLFEGCKELESIDVSELDTNNLESTYAMFYGCKKLEEIDVSTFDMSNVISTAKMFYNCSGMKKVDLGKSKMQKLRNTSDMFYNCCELEELDLSTIYTSNVVNMEGMFMECRKVKALDVSHFDTANVTTMKNMFANCCSIKELDVAGFDTSKVTDMSGMFLGCDFVKELAVSHFDTAAVTDVSYMFSGCLLLKKLDVCNFNTSKVTLMVGTFASCTSLEKLDISNFDMSKVKSTEYMFSGCVNLSDFKFASDKELNEVMYMQSMFEGCRSLKTLDLKGLETAKVGNANYMFKDCSGLTDLSGLSMNAYRLKTAEGMFQGCSSLVNVVLPVFAYGITNINSMFEGCTSLRTLRMDIFSARNMESVNDLCKGCSSLEYIELPFGEADKIERMDSMFEGCSSLTKVDMQNFRTPNVIYISRLFAGCSNLTSVTLYEFDGNDNSSLYGVFEGCSKLQSVDLSQFKPSSSAFVRNMFKDCDNLIEVRVTPELLQCMATCRFTNFENCHLFSDFYVKGTTAEWDAVRSIWQSCKENKIRYAAVHLSDGTIEQDIYHENETFHYIENGGFESQKPMSNSYTCDLSPLFDSSYNYHHDLAKVSIRAAMAAMSTNGGTNSGNIEEMMNDLNISNRVIHYPNPSYNSIGYAMGTRRIYHNNEKKTLIMVAIRGGGYGAEWGGNANVGSGMNHEGFDLAAKQVYVALNQYIGELKADEFTDGSDIVVWISGYSRGAATTNLLAAKLSDDNLASGVLAEYNVTEDHISAVKNINVHAFCFECPQNTTDANSNSLKYANIVNIINPKDFVTYVAMNNGWDWKFRRYGKDYVLPDEANVSGYATHRRRMELAYAGESVPEIEMGQSVHNKNVATMIANTFRRKSFPIIYEGAVQKIATSAMAEGKNIGDIIWENIMELHAVSIWKVGTNSGSIAVLASEFLCIKDNIASAHYPELCMAWMDSISEEVLKQKKSFWKVFVNCPVDIYVYQDENLVGLIKDDTPQEIENGIITMMDDNGQKVLVLPGDSKYKLLCKATDNGTMTITTSCYEQTENLPTSVVSYYELPLQTGAVYEAFTTTSNFALKDVSGNSIVPSVFQSGADVKMYRVALSVEGNGEVTGVNTYAIGEFAKVTAHPLENEKFLGWYEDGKLVSGEVEYRFCVKKDTNLVAKFTQNCCESKNNEKNVSDEKVSTGRRYVIKKHTYEVTSVTKKTVAFVKTASKLKSITIPSYVTIDGAKYKVTTIASKAMKGNKKVTKVTIGNNVTSIGASAFSGCKKLTKVTLGKGVTKIGKKAFYNCKKLKSVTIKSKKLKSVGKYAFKGIATKAQIKCPSKKYMKYKKMLVRSKIGKKVKIR